MDVRNPGLRVNLRVDGVIPSAELLGESHTGLGTRHGLQQVCIWHHFCAGLAHLLDTLRIHHRVVL